MKKIHSIIILTVLLATALSCQKVERVSPTANRQGITSLTAIFTSGPFVDQDIVKYTIEDETADNFVIPIPWYYPETSDNVTDVYMTKVRVKAELQPNCFIDPGLTVLDLTKENYYTYTNAQGEKQKICITGKRVKSSKCELISFSLTDPPLTGVVDKAKKKVSIISAEDLSSCVAEFEISAHAAISPDPSKTALNYNSPVELTITADDGSTKNVYSVVKEVPEKIPYGFNAGTLEQLFNFDPASTIGMPAFNQPVCISMAAIKGNLIVCLGDGSAPVYLNRITGVKLGEIALGQAAAASVTSDENENMLICNHAEADETINIFRTSSVTAEPTLLYSFTNDSGLPAGYRIKVAGDVKSKATIIITCEGIYGITTSSQAIRIDVDGGVVTGHSVLDFSPTGLWWNYAPDEATVVPASSNPADGFFESSYADGACTLSWIKGDGSIGSQMNTTNGNSWGWNANCLDSKKFNNANYLASLVLSYFPHWGIGPQLYLYDITDKSQLTGEFTSAPALVLANPALEWYQAADAGVCSGDVLIAPTADGFKIYVYYYDHNSGLIGGYSADCIKGN